MLVSVGVALIVSLIGSIAFRLNYFLAVFISLLTVGVLMLLARERLRWRQRLFDHIDDLADIERGTGGSL